MRPLTGREPELTVLTEFVAALPTHPRHTLLQVAGEPGIGKSRLLRELAGLARDRGCLVLDGRAAEFEGELPFGIFRHALGDWSWTLTPERRQQLAQEAGPDVAVVLDEFASAAHNRAAEVREERYRAYHAVRRLLAAVASDAPLVLVLDDVQWADPGSIELLSYLHAHPPRGAVLLAIGFRPAQLAEPLARALAAAVRHEDAVRLDLAPLSEAAAAQLLGTQVSADLAQRCYEQSGGNPFLLLALADAAAGGRLPSTLHDALASELSSVSPVAHVLLRGAAVTGDPFDWSLAARAADIDDQVALTALDELLDFSLVSATHVVGQFAFRHPAIRAAVYESAPTPWRMRAHGRVAAALEASGAGPSERAPHVERSARRGDTEAAALLIAAGEASEQRAPAVAARWYSAAVRLLSEANDTEPQRLALMVNLATALAAGGHLQESRAVLGDVLERLPGDHPERAPVVAACASAENLLGRHRDADTRLRAARRTVSHHSPGAVALSLELGATAGFENRAEDMAKWATRAVEGAIAAGSRSAAAAAVGQLALARYFLGLPTHDAADDAAARLDALEDAELATRLDLGLWVGWTEAVLERYERAIAHCQRVIDVSRASGQGATLLVTLTAQAWAQMWAGRLTNAEATLAEAIEVGRLAPHLFFVTTLGLSAQVATARGDYQAAVRAGEECVELARSADPGLIPGMSGLYLATPLIQQGDARAARDVLLDMSGGNHELQTSRSGHAAAFEVLTRAEIALGRVEAAEYWARRAQAATHGYQLPAEATYARRAQARVALAQGDADRSAQLALAAADAAPHAPIEAARCRVLAGQALARAGERLRAIRTLEEAADDLARIGADGYGAEAEKALRQLGRRVARRASAPRVGPPRFDALTERELEIALRVNQSLTNREIAAALFLSEKTIERHLSRVFEKLRIPNRTALAQLMQMHAAPGTQSEVQRRQSSGAN